MSYTHTPAGWRGGILNNTRWKRVSNISGCGVFLRKYNNILLIPQTYDFSLFNIFQREENIQVAILHLSYKEVPI